jgi:hypothetical protein
LRHYYLLFTHAGVDGPVGDKKTSKNELDKNQMTLKGWGDIDFNWSKEGVNTAGFYGCNTGKDPKGAKASFVTEISGQANMKDVFVWGQTSSSYPSTSTNVRETTKAIADGNHTTPTYLVGARGFTTYERVTGDYATVPANAMRISRNGIGETSNAVGQPYYQIGKKKK